MKVCILTLGCKVNAYESEMIKEKFLTKNYQIVDNFNEADIVIVNTCSVTNVADNKSKKLLRKIRRENPQAILAACGCMTQNHQTNLELDIDILIGTKNKSKIVDLIENYIKNKQQYCKFESLKDIEFEDMQINKFSDHTRAFLKIQDGCNNYCSYCIIPYMRGSQRCKKFSTAIKEAKILVNNGHKEIVLTGIHTGSYKDDEHDLVDLIEEISKIDNLERIRISSIEILEINAKFLKMLKNNPKVCDHLHIPLQSGSDKILKLMNRRYNKQQYAQIINKIRTVRPNISITTDLIVGFPNETEELFLESYKFCQEINFSKIHVFPFSLRSNTKAEEIPNHIDNSIKKQRAKKMIELSLKLEEEYYQKFINKNLDVLIEKVYDNYSIGHTSNYLQVKIPKTLQPNKIYKVKIVKICKLNVYGELIDCVISN